MNISQPLLGYDEPPDHVEDDDDEPLLEAILDHPSPLSSSSSQLPPVTNNFTQRQQELTTNINSALHITPALNEWLLSHFSGGLGAVLRLLGVLPCVPLSTFSSATSTPQRVLFTLLRWLPLSLSSLLVLFRVLRAVVCTRPGHNNLQSHFFGVALGAWLVAVTVNVLLVHSSAQFVSRPIARSCILALQVAPEVDAHVVLRAHGARLRQEAKRLAIVIVLVTLVVSVSFNVRRLQTAAEDRIGENHAFEYSCDPSLARLVSPMVYAVLILLSTVVGFLYTFMWIALTVWTLGLYARDVGELHRWFKSLGEAPGEFTVVQARAEDLPALLSDSTAVRRRRSTVSTNSLVPHAEYMLVMLRSVFQAFGAIGLLQLRSGAVAVALGIQSVITIIVVAMFTKETGRTTHGSLWIVVIGYCVLSFTVARVAQFLRRSGKLYSRLRSLARSGVLPDTMTSERYDTGATELAPTFMLLPSRSAHSQQSDAGSVSTVQTSSSTLVVRKRPGFLLRFVRVYRLLLISAALITLVVTVYAAGSVVIRLPTCVKIEIHDKSPLPVFNTDTCSTRAFDTSYLAGIFLSNTVGVFSPIIIFALVGPTRVSATRDMIVPGLGVVVVAVVVQMAIVFGDGTSASIGGEFLYRAPSVTLGVVNLLLVVYRLQRPGTDTDRPAISGKAAWIFALILLFLLFQIFLVSGLLVTVFILSNKDERFFLALFGMPALSMAFRQCLAFLCERFDRSSPRGWNSVMCVALSHVHMSLVTRMLLASTGFSDQILTVTLWSIGEVSQRAMGPYVALVFSYAVLPAGKWRSKQIRRAEHLRKSRVMCHRLYGHQLAELVAIPAAVGMVLAFRAILADNIHEDVKRDATSTGELFISFAVQSVFETLSDLASVAAEEKLVERGMLDVWATVAKRHALTTLAGVLICVALVLGEFTVLVGNYVRLQ